MRTCRPVLFRKRQLAAEMIVTCARSYLRFSLGRRDVEDLMAKYLMQSSDTKGVRLSRQRTSEEGIEIIEAVTAR
jgi:hypothetical protein